MKMMRCPYCTSDLSKSIKWIIANCPPMKRKAYAAHVNKEHKIKHGISQFDSLISTHKV